jgi:hypothetical protein
LTFDLVIARDSQESRAFVLRLFLVLLYPAEEIDRGTGLPEIGAPGRYAPMNGEEEMEL